MPTNSSSSTSSLLGSIFGHHDGDSSACSLLDDSSAPASTNKNKMKKTTTVQTQQQETLHALFRDGGGKDDDDLLDTHSPCSTSSNHSSSSRSQNSSQKSSSRSDDSSSSDRSSNRSTSSSHASPDETEAQEERDNNSNSSHPLDLEVGAQYPHTQQQSQEDEDVRTVFVGNLPLGSTRKTLERLFRHCGRIVSTRIRGVPIVRDGVKIDRANDPHRVRRVAIQTGQVDESGVVSKSCVGYVVFASAESVAPALELNNIALPDNIPHDDGGTTTLSSVRYVRVDRLEPTHDARRSVFVGNLPYHTDEETLRAHVVQCCGGGRTHHSITGNHPRNRNRDDRTQTSSSRVNNDDKEETGSSSSSSSLLFGPTDIEGIRVVRNRNPLQHAGHHPCRGFAYVLLKHAQWVPTVLQQVQNTTYLGRVLRVQVCGTRTKNCRGEYHHHHQDGGGSRNDSIHRTNNSINHGEAISSSRKRPRHGPSSSAPPSNSSVESATGALRRILAASNSNSAAFASKTKSGPKKKKRARGPTEKEKRYTVTKGRTSNTAKGRAARKGERGTLSSKRLAAETKNKNRMRKIQKRMNKGMGKQKSK